MLMARRRRKKALYEVMSKARLKPPFDKKLEPLHPKEPAKAEPSTAKPDMTMPEKPVRWWRKPKAVQLNAGRVEISLPYQLAIAVLLGLVLLMLIAFRVGFWLGHIEQRGANPASRAQNRIEENAVERADVGTARRPELGDRVRPPERKPEPGTPKGNYRIVIQTYGIRAHLEPVKVYFDQAGIKTEIRKIRDRYYLVTGDKFRNPDTEGTDDYLVKQKIIALGTKYKAPPGYETFGVKSFQTAYAMRFDD